MVRVPGSVATLMRTCTNPTLYGERRRRTPKGRTARPARAHRDKSEMALCRQPWMRVSTRRARTAHHLWAASSASRRCLGFLPRQLGIGLEVALALVLAQNAGFIDARLESTQHLVEGLSIAGLDVH